MKQPNKLKKAALLDRDGVLNELLFDGYQHRSPRNFSEFRIIKEVQDELPRLKGAGYLLLVITNQPEISRGLLRYEELKKMNEELQKRLPIDDIFVCFHDDADDCNCRKPKPGMILQAAAKWDLDLSQSFFIGDTWKDVEAGRRAGCKTILIESFHNNRESSPDIRVSDFSTAVNLILL